MNIETKSRVDKVNLTKRKVMLDNFNNKAKIWKEQSTNLEGRAIYNKKSLMKSKDFLMMKEEKLYPMKRP